MSFLNLDLNLLRVFDAVITSSDAPSAGKLAQTLLGDLVYVAPGDKQKHVFHWDPAGFKFAPLP